MSCFYFPVSPTFSVTFCNSLSFHIIPFHGRSTGFVLEGFPRTSEEVRYLQDAGLFPDAAIILQVN